MKAGNKVSILKTLVHSHFSNNTSKFRFGDGKNVKKGEKGYETNLWFIIRFFCNLNKIFRVQFCLAW